MLCQHQEKFVSLFGELSKEFIPSLTYAAHGGSNDQCVRTDSHAHAQSTTRLEWGPITLMKAMPTGISNNKNVYRACTKEAGVGLSALEQGASAPQGFALAPKPAALKTKASVAAKA